MPLRSPSPPVPADSSPPPVVLAEERSIVLPTSGWIDEVWLGGQRLSVGFVGQDRTRMPYIEDQDARTVTLRLTDWVGRLPFRLVGERGETVQEVVVFPSKLSRDPATAFAALSSMIAELPELQSRLRFEGELPDTLRDLQTLWQTPVQASTLLEVAAEAWRLWQIARRQPHAAGRSAERRVAGGQVPDRVDWNRTLDLWGRGGFPQHVALDLPPPPLPAALPALRELWQSLEAATEKLPAGTLRDELRLRFGHALKTLPRPHPEQEDRLRRLPTDPLTRHIEELTQRVRRLSEAVSGLPGGRVRMAELYEFWAQIRLARALGAGQGELSRTAEGLYTGTLHSEQPEHGTTVSLNPRMMFGGVGTSWQTLQPDVLALHTATSGREEALVADVKYRPVDRMNPDQQREVNDQLLRYMGLVRAASGLVLWPGGDIDPDSSERLVVRELPLGRARLIRLRLHPLDPPERLDQDLRELGLWPATSSPEE